MLRTRLYTLDSMDFHSSDYSSRLKSSKVDHINQQFDEKQSNDNLKLVCAPRKSIENQISRNDSSSWRTQKTDDPMNPIPKFQFRTSVMHDNQVTIGSSFSLRKNPTGYKLTTDSKKCISRKKYLRRKQIHIRPPWISSIENSAKNNYKSIKRTSLSCKQRRDPCQILESYTRFKRIIYCKSVESIYVLLSQDLDISSNSFIRNTHICNVDLIDNDKI